jgi:hypothetical protein
MPKEYFQVNLATPLVNDGRNMRGLVRDILDSHRLQPVFRFARRSALRIQELANEFFLNIETRQSASGPGASTNLPNDKGIQTDKAAFDDNIIYLGSEYRNFPAIVRGFGLGRDDVFYDIGCGKGRVLCLVAHAAEKGGGC